MQMDGRRGLAAIVGLLALYLLLQIVYILRLPLSMDEFHGASTLAPFASAVPYRDFAPYKTVLGYYLQLGPYSLGGDTWQRLMAVKMTMAAFNTAALAIAAAQLGRMYSRGAVLAGLVLTVVMSTFLERSSELRVDMMTSWAGMASLLLLLNGRAGWAGATAALSFLISQKGIYYCIAGAVSLAVLWLRSGGSSRGARQLFRFSSAVLGVVAAYVGFWALWAGVERVVIAVFWSPRRMALDNLYVGETIWLRYWRQTVMRNPVFYGLAVLALVRLAPDRSTSHNRTLVPYALTLTAMALFHRQPWPYFFLLIIPTALVLVVALIDWSARVRGDWCPLGRSRLVVGLCLGLGVIFPLFRIPVNLSRDSGFQREMVVLAEHVLAPRDTYLAGVNLLRGRKQPVGTLRWLDTPQRAMVQQLSADRQDALLDSLRRSRLKVVIDNYRLAQLPPSLREFIASETTPLWGNLRIYGPSVGSGNRGVVVKFTGRYSVLMPAGGTASIDTRPVTPGGAVDLTEGAHQAQSSHGFRLKLLPEGWESKVTLNHRVPRVFFPNMNTY
jgi:hypothetical protein